MKKFLSKVTGSFKVKRTPIAPCDCRDFVAAVPDAPDLNYLRSVVQERHFGSAPPADSPFEQDRRDHVVRSTVFDLVYRCGAGGRCTCAGSPTCRYPQCFTLRPITKGAEVQAERQAYEVDDAPTAPIRALVTLAKEEKLDEAIKGIQHLVDSLLRENAQGKELCNKLGIDGEPGNEFHPGQAKYGEHSTVEGVNPLKDNEQLREEVMGLYLWRASLLVCLRRDEQAVHSLLNLADVLTQEHRMKLYCAAATWATLNDMEVIYYRSVFKQYEHFPLSEHFATERNLLLAKVFEAMQHDDYYTQYCTHVVFSKEVTATVSRAQAAQVNGDLSEDPMRSLCLVLALPYYRFRISDGFWKHFFNLLCMPPIPPPTEAEKEQDPATMMGLTPNYVLDAVGRSMLLHHLVMFADVRRKEIDSGIVADRVAILKAKKMEPHRSDYDQVLTDQEFSVAMTRMRQLLVVVKTYEEQAGRIASGGAEDASKIEGGAAAGGSGSSSAQQRPMKR